MSRIATALIVGTTLLLGTAISPAVAATGTDSRIRTVAPTGIEFEYRR